MASHGARCVYWSHWQCVYLCSPVHPRAYTMQHWCVNSICFDIFMLSCVDRVRDSHLMTTALINEQIQASVLVCDLTLTRVVCRGRAETYPCWFALPSPPLLQCYTCQHYTRLASVAALNACLWLRHVHVWLSVSLTHTLHCSCISCDLSTYHGVSSTLLFHTS